MGEILSSRFVRFLVVGGINTAATYLIFRLFLLGLAWPIAFTLTFAVGMVFAFVLNARWVFEVKASPARFALFTLIYVGAYLVSILLIKLGIDIAGVSAEIAPLFVIALVAPAQFLTLRGALMLAGQAGPRSVAQSRLPAP